MNDESDHHPAKNYAGELLAFLTPQPADLDYVIVVTTNDLYEIKDIADKAKALKECARDANEWQIETSAAETQIAAERLLGEFLVKLKRYEEFAASCLRSSTSARNPIDDHMIDGALDEMGEQFIAAVLDRPALCEALKKAWTAQNEIDRYRPGSRARRSLKHLARIHNATDVLLSLLRANDDAAERIGEVEPQAALNVLRLGIAAENANRQIDEDIKETTAKYRRRIPQKIKGKIVYRSRVPTAPEWLAGVELPCIYEEFFGRSKYGPLVSRRGPKLSPMGLFIRVVLSKFGIKYTDESIERAWTDLRKLRARRRAVRRQPIGQK